VVFNLRRANSEFALQGITVAGWVLSMLVKAMFKFLSGYGTLDNIALAISEGTVTA